MAYQKTTGSTGGVKVGSTYDEARTRKVNAEAEVAELHLETIHGRLMPTEDVIKEWEGVLVALKGKLLALPSKIAPVLASETTTAGCKSVLEDVINEALEELSSYDPTTDVAEHAESAKAAAKIKRKSVGRSRKTP